MIIGLSGYARSGKDEAAKGLAQLGFKRVAFADKLREFLYLLNPYVGEPERPFITKSYYILQRQPRVRDVIDRFGWDGYKGTPFGDEIRSLLQRLGTECGRGLISDTIWIDAALNEPVDDIVITDCRFPNEAQAIKDRGGIIIRIERDGVGPANDHPSETALDSFNWDYIVWNDGSINQLHEEVRTIAAIH